MLRWELRGALRSHFVFLAAGVLSVLQKVEELDVFDAGLLESLPLIAIIELVVV